MHAEPQGAPFAAGQMLDDKYRLDELLEVGGMGAVYVGLHTQLQKRVAIKVLRTELAGAMEIVERFQREAIAATRIGHENIVEVTDIGKAQNGAPFIVMELLEGENLAARIKRVGALPLADACHIAVEILSAVDAAHRAGIVHRDLKPENVFLARKSRGESVKILDFGISRMIQTDDGQNRLTLTGLVLGTPYYMSPEQACGESEITAAADIYATGVILYEMLTAKVPFEATNYNSLIYKILSGNYPPVRSLVALPEPLEQIVNRAMAPKAENRFGSATEFARALEPFLPLTTSSQPFPTAWTPTPPAWTPTPMPAIDPGRTAYAPTMADSGQLPTAAAVDQVALAKPVRKSRGGLVAIAAVVLVLGGIGAAVAVMQSSQRADSDPPGETATVKDTETAAGGATGTGTGTETEPETATATETATETKTKTETEPETATKTEPETATKTEPETATKTEPEAATRTEPAPVTLSFVVTPADAEIRVDGTKLHGKTVSAPPGSPEVVVEVSRDGYVAKQRKVAFESNREIEIILERAARSSRGKRSTRPDKKTGGKRIITDSPYDD